MGNPKLRASNASKPPRPRRSSEEENALVYDKQEDVYIPAACPHWVDRASHGWEGWRRRDKEASNNSELGSADNADRPGGDVEGPPADGKRPRIKVTAAERKVIWNTLSKAIGGSDPKALRAAIDRAVETGFS